MWGRNKANAKPAEPTRPPPTLADILSPDSCACQRAPESRKAAVFLLADLLAAPLEKVDKGSIFEILIEREHLGSTALGGGKALPHGRFAKIRRPVAALATLSRPVDFEADDGQPINLLAALLVPQDAVDAHLGLLAAWARLLGDGDFCRRALAAATPTEMHRLVVDMAGAKS